MSVVDDFRLATYQNGQGLSILKDVVLTFVYTLDGPYALTIDSASIIRALCQFW